MNVTFHQAIASLLVVGGILLVLTGNDNEPEVTHTTCGTMTHSEYVSRSCQVGPAVLSQHELESAFLSSGKFELLEIKEGRFDATPHYDALEKRPLCWEALFRRIG